MRSLLALGIVLVAFMATSKTAEAQQCFVNRGFTQPVVVNRGFVQQPVFVNRGFNGGFVQQPVFVGRRSFIGSPFIGRRSFIASPFIGQPVFINRGPSFGIVGRRGGFFLNF